MKPLILALVAILGMTLASAAIAFPVTWSFFETGCTSPDGGCQNLQLPASLYPGVELDLPDINSSGSYHFSSFFGVVTETGDTDFLFDWSGRITPLPNCAGIGEICQWDIAFASTASGLGISVQYLENVFSDNIDIGPKGGTISSDSFLGGCGLFAACSITGYWALTAVPEPSSLTILGMVTAVLALRLWQRRRAGPTR